MKENKKNLSLILMSVGMALILAFSIVVNVLALGQFDNILTQFFRKSPDSLAGDTLGADVDYYESDFGSAAELYAYEEEVVAEIAQEGVTLLKNDGVLPLAEGTTLSLFSHSSVDLVSGGSGSGSGSFELTKNLREGLEHAGLKVNDRLWNFYSVGAGSGEDYTRGVGSINYGRGLDWNINEVPLSVITADSGVVSSFDQYSTAAFVLTRTGGEGNDLARGMDDYVDTEKDLNAGKHPDAEGDFSLFYHLQDGKAGMFPVHYATSADFVLTYVFRRL